MSSFRVLKGTASYTYESGDSGANAAYPAMYESSRGEGPSYPQYDQPYRDQGDYYDDGITESYRASYLYGGKGDEG